MTDTDVIQWICRKLGLGVVDLELSDDQLQDAVDESKRWFSSYIGEKRLCPSSIQVVSGANEYDVLPDVSHVTDVYFSSGGSMTDALIFAGADIPIDITLSTMPVLGNAGYSGLVQALQYRELAKSTLGLELDWEYDRFLRKIRLFPINAGARSLVFRYEYLSNSVDLSRLNQHESRLVRDYALAEAIDTLGWIRTKYSSMPSASGDFSMNGDTLLSRAETMKSELTETIRKFQRPLAFFAE